MKQAQEGKVKLTWLEGGNLVNLKGVIPVTDESDYHCAYQDLKDEKWVPIENPMKPIRQYPAFGKPLTTEQIERLVRVPKAPAPKME